MTGMITVWADHDLGVINPNIYGSFAEHLGRCVYGGLWVGPESQVPNDEGLRTAAVEALRAMRLPILRWPGGCFADDYHWEWGVGAERRSRRNLWWTQPETNEFGTNEFLRLCAAVGCEPYLCVNVGSGTVEEAVNWMEYCNSAQDSRYANLRRTHGHREPYGVRYWGVGNENWGCGGSMTGQQYAYECRKYATFMRKLGVDVEGGVKLVAAGHGNDDAWDAEMFRYLHGSFHNLDAVSIHRYSFAGSWEHKAETLDPTAEHFYRLMGDVVGMEERVRRARALVEYYSPPGHPLELFMDEWGTWYRDTEEGLFQQAPLKDGLFAAAALNMFNRHSPVLAMTSTAQTANVLQALLLTRGSETVLTPTYHAYEMMKGHQGATLLASRASSSNLADSDGREYEALSLSASRSEDGQTLTLSVVNLSCEQDCATEIMLRGVDAIQGATARILTAESTATANDFEDGERVKPQAVPVAAGLPSFAHTFPAHSLTVIEIAL
ncbi:MAG: alpha-N-arabinofuranosidase [candidate division WS1 bacterium]|nr:alpha-N-arabinofuranosidase [candidate division WS1 bacterium]